MSIYKLKIRGYRGSLIKFLGSNALASQCGTKVPLVEKLFM